MDRAYLCSIDIFGGVVISAHTQHILCAVVKLREAIELAVGEVDRGLVDAIQRGVGLVGAVEEGLKLQAALLEISTPTQV